MSKPIICVDFDGVLHSYTSGWQGPGIISDEPVPGAIEWLKNLTKHFNVCIFSSRNAYPEGIREMIDWLRFWGFKYTSCLQFPLNKPSAFLTIDDRCVTFLGVFPDPQELLRFKPWNRGETPAPVFGPDRDK